MLRGRAFFATVTIPASGRASLAFTSPAFVGITAATSTRPTFARIVRLRTTGAAVTVSTDDGLTSLPVPVAPATGDQPVIIEGHMTRLFFTGTNGDIIRVNAEVAG